MRLECLRMQRERTERCSRSEPPDCLTRGTFEYFPHPNHGMRASDGPEFQRRRRAKPLPYPTGAQRQVVLIGILGAEMGLKFAEQQHRSEICKVNAARRPARRKTTRCLRGLGDNRPERVGSICARLKFERQVKKSIREKAASAERRLSP